MKNMKIKLLSVMISALLCSHLWAQGSESVSAEVASSETVKKYEKSYTITVKLENNKDLTQTIGLTTVNGKTTITSGSGLIPEPGCSYSAFFIADDGTYYGFDYKSNPPDGQYAVWMPYTKEEQKNYVKHIYKNIIGKNCQLSTETENVLKDVGYTELSSSDLAIIDKSNFIRTGKDKNGNPKNNDFDKLYIYNEKKGIFFLAVEQNDGNAKIVCFRDKKSKTELIDKLNKEDFKNWLKADIQNKNKNSNNEVYKELSQLIYESLKTPAKRFTNLYGNGNDELFILYLQLAMENNRNVYFSELKKKDDSYKPAEYILCNTSEEKNEIVKAAKEYSKNHVKFLDGLNDIPATYTLKNDPKIAKKYMKKAKKQLALASGADDIGFLNGVLYLSNINIKEKEQIIQNYNSYKQKVNEYINNAKKDLDFEKPSIKNIITLDIEELNKLSSIVSDISNVNIGDFILFNHTVEKQNTIKENLGMKIGVIIDKGNGTIGDMTVVWMNENNNIGAEERKLSEIWKSDDGYEIPKYTEIRRFFVVGSGKEEDQNENWNLLNEDINNISIDINWMREDTQTSGESFRWIPNTGEYLSLEKICVNAFNELGIRVRGDDWKVTLAGAKDRNWKNGNNNSNVYNNSECNFDIKVGDKIGELSKSSDSENYSITWYKDKEKKIKEEDKNIPKFEIKTKDNLLFYGTDALEIKIRPESAEKARPGDDLLLVFKLENNNSKSDGNGSSGKDSNKTYTVSEKNYIAVYDKKMIWRANLYLDKPEASLGDKDWNDAHPWNAPATDDYDPKIWFGKNEWNRNFKISSYTENGSIFTGLNELPQGNGGQVTELISFTPLRTIAGTVKKPDKNNNIILNTVAYSYPQHNHEKATGDAGSMDSPFDYNKKMLVQQLQLNKWYDSTGKRKQNADADYDKDGWGEFKSPDGKWFNYESTTNTQYKFDGNNAMFIPSLGLRIYSKSNAEEGTSTQLSSFLGTDEKGKIGIYEAGTDCVGFAQRCASYKNNKYSWVDLPEGWTEYKNGNGIGTNDLWDVQNKYNNEKDDNRKDEKKKVRNYPRTQSDSTSYDDAVNIMHTREGYDNSNFCNLTDDEYSNINKQYIDEENIKKKLLTIVPGDIFVKDSENDGTNYDFNNHIAIIASVPENAYNMSVNDLLQSIVIIEGEFSWKIQSVIKDLTLFDYNRGEYTVGTLNSIYKNFNSSKEGYSDNQTISLYTRSYAIRRLK